MMSDQFGNSFKMFPIVELTKLGGQNFKLGLENERSIGTAALKHYSTANTHSK